VTTTAGYLAQFALLLLFWVLLSSQMQPLFLIMGAASAAVVTTLTHRHLAAALYSGSPARIRDLPLRAWRFAVYGGWLVIRMVAASIQVAYFVVHPRMPLDPAVLRFRTRLRSPLARVMLANTITLVPGTLTIHVEDDEYLVHALVPSAAADLLAARMQNTIGRMFLEEPDAAVWAVWEVRGGSQ
jgi:multicomponent Na+:H+ antiporter subunit E